MMDSEFFRRKYNICRSEIVSAHYIIDQLDSLLWTSGSRWMSAQRRPMYIQIIDLYWRWANVENTIPTVMTFPNKNSSTICIWEIFWKCILWQERIPQLYKL